MAAPVDAAAKACDTGACLYGILDTTRFAPPEHAVLSTFSSAERTSHILLGERKLPCDSPIEMRHVEGDLVQASQLLVETGVGHAFDIFHRGHAATRIEAQGRLVEGKWDLSRIAVVSPDYSALTVAAGMIPTSSMLEFDEPESYTKDLEASLSELNQDENVYIPERELIVSPRLSTLPLTSASTEQREVWRATVSALTKISRLTKAGVDQHLVNELERVRKTGVVVARHRPSAAWVDL